MGGNRLRRYRVWRTSGRWLGDIPHSDRRAASLYFYDAYSGVPVDGARASLKNESN